MLCTWCGETATWMLVADADLHNHDHAACDEHRTTWAHLYRRSVAVAPDLVLDLREDEPVDLRDTEQRAADEPIGRHER
jgi:hypothetical protein